MKKLLKAHLEAVDGTLKKIEWKNPHIYADFLAQTYSFVSHSTRLLALAASRLPMGDEPLFRRFTAHLAEEKNHEKLAAHDIQVLGFALHDFPERAQTRAFYETQYYKIEHQAPVALLGYILFLEALAAKTGPVVYHQVCTSHGEKAGSFLKVHVEEDPEHVQKALEAIEMVVRANATHGSFVIQNLEQSGIQYRLMLEAVREGGQHLRTSQPRAG